MQLELTLSDWSLAPALRRHQRRLMGRRDPHPVGVSKRQVWAYVQRMDEKSEGKGVDFAVEDPSAFTDLLGNFVTAAVAFRDGQMFGTVDGERVPVMTVRKLAEEPGVFADAFQAAEVAIATATKYGLLVEAEDEDGDSGQEIADEIADAFE
jgi:hypothetical protein